VQLALATTGDIDVSTGRRRFITGIEASRQAWQIAMRLFRGEWHLNRAAGFPWTQVVFVERPSLLTIRAKLHEMALKIPGIVEVLSVHLEVNGYTLSGSVLARFENGDTVRFQVYDPSIQIGDV
jgi:hypothetical protein